MACDVADYAAVEALVAATTQRFGRPDILINNAGVIEPIATIATPTPPPGRPTSRSTWSVRSTRCARCCLACWRRVAERSSTSPPAPRCVRWRAGAPIAAGKAGMAMLTRAIMLEEGAHGIRVFGFQPGTTDTDMQVLIRASGMNIISQIPRANLTPVAEPAKAIVYLCTPDADDLVWDGILACAMKHSVSGSAWHDRRLSRSAQRRDVPARHTALVRPGPCAAAADDAARASRAGRSIAPRAACGATARRCRCRWRIRSPWARAARRCCRVRCTAPRRC